MANTIKLKRGTSTPSTSDISTGEVAIDTSAQKLYINDSGTVKEIGGGGAGTGEFFVKAKDGSGNLSNSGINTFAGYLAGNALANGAQENTFYGTSAGKSVTTGDDNTYIGFECARETTDGNTNTALGSGAYFASTGGNANTVLGAAAMGGGTPTGNSNVAVGKNSLYVISSGSSNTAVGYESLKSNTTADANTAVGYQALTANTTGKESVAFGYRALTALTTNDGCVAVGFEAGLKTTGAKNTLVGSEACKEITSGASNVCVGWKTGDGITTGSNHVAIGSLALGSIATADACVAVGHETLASTTGLRNTAVGYQALKDLTSGTTNVGIGVGAGDNLRTGSNNICIGNFTYASAADVDNEITLGNSSTTKFRIPGLNFSLKDTTATEDYVLTVDANGDCGWEAAAAGVGGATGVDFNDNVKARWGTGNDLEIFHDGSHSYIQDSGTGNLRICGDDVHIQNAAATENIARFYEDGGVELFYDHSKKAETYGSGFLLDGSVLKFENVASTPSASGNVHIYAHDTQLKMCGGSGILFEEGGFSRWWITSGALYPHGTTYHNLGTSSNRVGNIYVQTSVDLIDDAELRIGSSDDLKLWHGSGHSWIKNITGSLYVAADAFRVSYADMTGTMITADNGGKVALYYDNAKKAETVSGGFTVTGTCTATAFSGDGSSLTGISASDSTKLPLAGGTLTGNTKLNDDVELQLGGGSDFQAKHDGTDTSLYNYTGDLYLGTVSSGDDVHIVSIDDIYLKCQGSEDGIQIIGNGGVKLYFDNALKAETSSTGFDVSAALKVATNLLLTADNGNIRLGVGEDFRLMHDGTDNLIKSHNGKIIISTIANNDDIEITPNGSGNVKLGSTSMNDNVISKWGTGDDLQIYHNGTNSLIHNATGDLVIRSDIFKVRNGAESEKLLDATANGTVDLYHDNSIKCYTTATGFKIHTSCHLHMDDSSEARFGSSDDLKIYTNGSASYIAHNGDGDLFISTGGAGENLYVSSAEHLLLRTAASENSVYCVKNSHVSLYYDNSQKFYTQSYGCVVAGDLKPESNNSHNLGDSSYRWANLYVNDMHFSNEGKSNSVDGTWGDWTLQEGDENIFMINNRTGKKYKMGLQEVN